VDEDEPVPFGGQAPDGGDEEGAHGQAGAAEASTPMGSDDEGGDQATAKTSSRRLLVAGVIVAVAALVVAGLILLISNVSDAISTGTGTATITWTPATGTPPPVGNLPQPFGGTIKGSGVSGINRTTISSKDIGSLENPSGKSPAEFQVFRLNGSFGGKAFTLGVYYQLNLKSLANTQIAVRGTYGTSTVKGTIAPPSAADLSKGSPPVDFHGTIGDFKVSGIIYPPTGNANKQTARATFTVTK
jgi:hypothetical protein